MMNRIPFGSFFTFFILINLNLFVYSQGNKVESTDKNYYEQLILNTDRELYIAGERIWFQISCFANNDPFNEVISKISYIELYDQKGNAVTRAKFRINNGVSSGNIEIPDNLSSGNYYLRAYTQFLRNYSPYLYPTRLITILNPNKPVILDKNNKTNEITISLQGGNLISGSPTKIAIRIAPKLLSQITESIIVSDKADSVTRLNLYSNGLALISFTPRSNFRYFLRLTLDNGEIIQRAFPEVYNNGILFKAEYENKNLKLSLISTALDFEETESKYEVEVLSQFYEHVLTRKIHLGEEIKFYQEDLTNGLLYILLKKNMKTVNVSSVFVPKASVRKIKITNNKEIYKPRELVELTAKVTKRSFHLSNCNVTVIRDKKITESKNILPVKITYNPVLMQNYLKNTDTYNDSLREQIDASLILYSKYYNTESFLHGLQEKEKLKWLPEIRDVGISGKLIDNITKKPLNNVIVYASVFGENLQFHKYRTRQDGKFFFSLNNLVEKQNLYVCTPPMDSLKVKILINNDFSAEYPLTDFIPLDVDTSIFKLLQQYNTNYQLNSAFSYHTNKIIKKKKFYPLPAEIPEISVILKDFINIPIMEEIFNEIVPFVSVRKKKGNYSLNVFDEKNYKIYKEPLILVDGVPVFDVNEIIKISPEIIQEINVINREYYLGSYIIHGLIRITTKTQNFGGIPFPKEANFFEYQTVSRESFPIFPDYKNGINKNRIPDFRNLLYWKADLSINQEGRKINFYSSDQCGDYRTIIRGYDEEGNLFYGELKIKIEN